MSDLAGLAASKASRLGLSIDLDMLRLRLSTMWQLCVAVWESTANGTQKSGELK